jgi:hypothetical protein
MASSLVIGAESGCETPVAVLWANTGAVARTRAAVVRRSVMAISSETNSSATVQHPIPKRLELPSPAWSEITSRESTLLISPSTPPTLCRFFKRHRFRIEANFQTSSFRPNPERSRTGKWRNPLLYRRLPFIQYRISPLPIPIRVIREDVKIRVKPLDVPIANSPSRTAAPSIPLLKFLR